jgi:hypothetical protein
MIAQSVADILNHHVKLAVEGIDRMYLNIYVPKLQHEQGIVWFFREHQDDRHEQRHHHPAGQTAAAQARSHSCP